MAQSPFFIAGAAVIALALGPRDPLPILVWNASASAAVGLYRIENRAPERGEFALVHPPASMKDLIEERGYLPAETPLIKRVLGLPGDEICREDETVSINKIHVADALLTDSFSRALPRWKGCVTLRPGEIFLLNDPERSLDGRYFGATKSSDVIGVAVPLLVQ